jgi:hypothetical protein
MVLFIGYRRIYSPAAMTDTSRNGDFIDCRSVSLKEVVMNTMKLIAMAALVGVVSIGSAYAADTAPGANYAPAHQSTDKHGWGGHSNSKSNRLQPYDGSAAPQD